MECRHTILINSKFLWLKIRTRADYNYRSQITLREWLNISRYEVGIYRYPGNNGGYKWWINKSKSIYH